MDMISPDQISIKSFQLLKASPKMGNEGMLAHFHFFFFFYFLPHSLKPIFLTGSLLKTFKTITAKHCNLCQKLPQIRQPFFCRPTTSTVGVARLRD